MSLASQVLLLASRISTEFKSVRTAIDTSVRYSRLHEVISGGGNISWDGTYLKWSSRFIVMPMHTNSYIDVAMPAAGYSITALGAVGDETNGPLRPSNLAVTAAGIKMTFWMGLYFRFSDAKFYMGTYNTGAWTNNHDFLLIAVHNADGNFIRLGNGLQVAGGQTLDANHPYYGQSENDARYASGSATTAALAAKADLNGGIITDGELPLPMRVGRKDTALDFSIDCVRNGFYTGAPGSTNTPEGTGASTAWWHCLTLTHDPSLGNLWCTQFAVQMTGPAAPDSAMYMRRVQGSTNTTTPTFGAWVVTGKTQAENDGRYTQPGTVLPGGSGVGGTVGNPYVENEGVTLGRLGQDVKPSGGGGYAADTSIALRRLGTGAGMAMPGTTRLNALSPNGDVTFNGYRATTLADPTAATDASTKQYVDNHTWGASRLAADVKPTQAGGTAALTDLALRAIGGTAGTAMSGAATLDTIPVAGPVPFGGYRATGQADPVSAQDSATKNYVDTRTPAVVDKAIVLGALTAHTWTDVTHNLGYSPTSCIFLRADLQECELDWRPKSGAATTIVQVRSAVDRIASQYTMKVVGMSLTP